MASLNISFSKRGFTLIEVMVSITIMTILSAIVVTSFPVVRNQQFLKVTQQELQDSLSRAQQLAFNETRDEQCLQRVGTDPEAQRSCSDVGVYVEPGAIIMFADTFNVNQNQYDRERDYVIGRKVVPSALTFAATSFLFQADPPLIIMFTNGRVQSAVTPFKLTLSTPSTQSVLNIFAYGQVEKAE